MRDRPSATLVALLVLASILLPSTRASAEWQIRPFLGMTFGGGTTLVDLEDAAGHPNPAFGVNAVRLGEVIGIEVDVGHAPGFFETGRQDRVFRSGATTVTGNIVGALPRRLTEYTLRPYLVGGFGVMHAYIDDTLGVLRVGTKLAAVDVGGGVTGFLTNRIGLSWELRYFRSVGGKAQSGLSFGAERLSFWRANMAVAIRR
jgi:hypothetical protein